MFTEAQADHRRPRACRSEQGSSSTARTPSTQNYFQAATRSATGGPARSSARTRSAACGAGRRDGGSSSALAASKLAFAPRGKLAARRSVIKRDLWEIGFKKQQATRPAPGPRKFATPPGAKAMSFGLGAVGGFVLVGLGLLATRRKR